MGSDITDDRLDHMLLLIGIQFRIDGDRDGLLGRLFRFRKRSRLGLQFFEALLTVEWNGIVDIMADSVLHEMGSEIVPDRFRHAYHVLVVDVIRRGLRR